MNEEEAVAALRSVAFGIESPTEYSELKRAFEVLGWALEGPETYAFDPKNERFCARFLFNGQRRITHPYRDPTIMHWQEPYDKDCGWSPIRRICRDILNRIDGGPL